MQDAGSIAPACTIWGASLELGDGPWPSDAAFDLLLRRAPARMAQPLRQEEKTAPRPASGSRSSSTPPVLPIQGPPGTGKTHTGATQILRARAAQGRKVGVTATSHAVICNLLDEVANREATGGEPTFVSVRRPTRAITSIARRSATQDHVFDGQRCGLAALASDDVDVVGGTTWLWATDGFRG